MAAPELGVYYNAMTRDMGSKLSGYYVSLQHRYGDPRVYAAQREQMRQRELDVVRSGKTQHTKQLLDDAYNKRRVQFREEHNARMSKRQSGHRTAASPPQSEEPQQNHKPRRRQPRASAPPQPSSSQSLEAPH